MVTIARIRRMIATYRALPVDAIARRASLKALIAHHVAKLPLSEEAISLRLDVDGL